MFNLNTWREAIEPGPVRLDRLVGLGALLAGFLPVLTFVETALIEPATRPPEVLLSVSMATTSVKNGLAAISVKTSIRNPTGSRVRLLADTLNVEGRQVQPFVQPFDPVLGGPEYSRDLGVYFAHGKNGPPPCDPSRQIQPCAVVPWGPSDVSEKLQWTPISRHALDKVSVYAFSNIPYPIEGKWYLDPGEEDSRTTVFYVPVSAYDYLHLAFETYSGRDSELMNSLEYKYAIDDGGKVYWTARISRLTATSDFTNPSDEEAIAYGLAYNVSIFVLPMWTSVATPTPPPQSP